MMGVYFFEALGTGLVKIGMSTDVEKRLASIVTMYPVRLLHVATERYVQEAGMWGNARSMRIAHMERRWHTSYAHLRRHGEWFEVDDELRADVNRKATVVHGWCEARLLHPHQARFRRV